MAITSKIKKRNVKKSVLVRLSGAQDKVQYTFFFPVVAAMPPLGPARRPVLRVSDLYGSWLKTNLTTSSSANSSLGTS